MGGTDEVTTGRRALRRTTGSSRPPGPRARRTSRALSVALLAMAVAVGALGWAAPASAATPGTREICQGPTVRHGVNVSSGQGSINWGQVAGAGNDFAYVRALDGIAFPDTAFVQNYQGAKAAGMKAGGYLFYRSWVDPTTQAHLFIDLLQQAGFEPGDLLPVIDVEKDVNSTSPVVPRDTIVANLRVVESIVTQAIGVRPVIYTGPDHWAVELGNPSGFEANALWIANYDNDCPEVPNSFPTWKFWQYEDHGTVPGIAGSNTNLNLFDGPLLPLASVWGPAFYESSPPTPASVGTPYTYRFRATGVPAPAYTIQGGSLPPGLTLDPTTGLLSGAPTTPGAYSFNVKAANVAGTALSGSKPVTILVAPPAAGFHSMVPKRALDSRTGTGGWNAKLEANAPRPLDVVTGTGVPSTASAVVMNVTVVDSTAESFLTVYPSGAPRPNASNLNFGAGQIIPNLVTVRIGDVGRVQFSTAVGATNVVADIVGYYDDGTGPGELFNGVPPQRILDNRVGNGWSTKLGAGESRDLQVTDRGGVPVGATSVVLNMTVTSGTKLSFLQVWPAGETRPNSSNLNAQPGQTIPNLVVVKLSQAGKVSIFNAEGTTDVIADVVGWFGATGSRFHALPTPTRILDSRFANGFPGRVGQTPRALTVTGRNGIPAGATGLVANVTVADGDSESFLTVYPGDQGGPPNPGSNLNFGRSQVIPNLTMLRLPTAGGGAGQLLVFNAVGFVYVIADAVGYFAP